MTDLLTLPAGPQLQRAIAERLGWKVYFREDLDTRFGGWCIASPEGKMEFRVFWGRLNDPELKAITPDDVWHEVIARDAVLPNWPKSVDAAMGLLPPGVRWQLIYDVDYGAHHRTGYSVAVDNVYYNEFADLPALAICRAWLKITTTDIVPTRTN